MVTVLLLVLKLVFVLFAVFLGVCYFICKQDKSGAGEYMLTGQWPKESSKQ